MKENNNIKIIVTTFPSLALAEKAAIGLVNGKLAACVQLSPGVTSIYRWQDKVEKEEEVVVHIKSTIDKVNSISDYILENHPYETPEILCISVDSGLESYLDWVVSQTS